MKKSLPEFIGISLGLIHPATGRFALHTSPPVLRSDDNSPRRIERAQVKMSARRVARNLKRAENHRRSTATV
jgi:hypothetical protein